MFVGIVVVLLVHVSSPFPHRRDLSVIMHNRLGGISHLYALTSYDEPFIMDQKIIM